LLALSFALAARSADAQTLKVDSNYEISGAGYKLVTTSDGIGDLPHKIVLPKGAISITFAVHAGTKTKGRCTAPCITIDGGKTYNDADGVGNGFRKSPARRIYFRHPIPDPWFCHRRIRIRRS
jgi:hypothetical protein